MTKFCPRCGTTKVDGGRFCVNCGLDMDAPAAAPEPAAEPDAGYIPAPEVATPPAVTADQPAHRSHTALIAVALIVVVAILSIGVGIIKLPGSSGGGDTITFTPPQISCANPAGFTIGIHLPATVRSGDTLTMWWDGHNGGSVTIDLTASYSSGTLVELPAGDWMLTLTIPAITTQTICASGGISDGVAIMAPGAHQLQLKGSGGVVVASGSYRAS
jgi:hypothetical protein